ncbi:hypothetical protein J6590_043012 [Homalodisca vitripennis]|nr:hypothetical protein J6590_043012 [Homalodisca vitripennis]
MESLTVTVAILRTMYIVRQPQGRSPGPMATNDRSTDESSGKNEQDWMNVDADNNLEGYLQSIFSL